jgi:hypothetical protein
VGCAFIHPRTLPQTRRGFLFLLLKLVVSISLVQCLYLFGALKPVPLGLLISWGPCKISGFPVRISILVLASFVLAADDLDTMEKAVQASKRN